MFSLPHLSVQMIPKVLDGVEIRALRWPWQAVDAMRLSPQSCIFTNVAGRIVLLEYDTAALLVHLLQVGHQVLAHEYSSTKLEFICFDRRPCLT